jgi:hypothetical protein
MCCLDLNWIFTFRKPITERSRGKKDPEQSQDEIEMAEYGKESERKYRLEENQINTTEKSLQQMFEDEANQTKKMDENEDVGVFEIEEISVDDEEKQWSKVTFHKKE